MPVTLILNGDPLRHVGKGVAVLGEDDELTLTTARISHRRVILQNARQFVPLTIFPRGHNGFGLMFKSLEDDNL